MSRLQSHLAALLVAATVGACAAPQVPAYRYPTLPKPAEGGALFIVFNVGQADAMLVMHGGKTLLFDAGTPTSKNARGNFRDIPRRLEALTGKRHLDYVVISHFHQDHVGVHGTGRRASWGNLGLWGLLDDEGVTVGTIVDRGTVTFGAKGGTQQAYESAIPRWIAERKIGERRVVKQGDLIDLGAGMHVEVMSANGNGRLLELRMKDPPGFDKWPPSENDYSVSLKFTQGDFELFSGGDLSGQGDRRAFGTRRQSYNDIESVVAGKVGDVEVYRVNHHGSSHSSNPCFVRVLHPEVSIFSTGDNSYGHPALRVFNALKEMGKVFVTGGADKSVYMQVESAIVHGDVEVSVAPDGKRYWVNGQELAAKSDEAERARPDYVAECKEDAETPKEGAEGTGAED